MVEVRSAAAGDADAIAEIYHYYVTETVVTFEEDPVDVATMGARIAVVQALGYPWLVATAAGELVGFAYAGRWRERSAYRYSVETTIYLDPDATGRGIGERLYRELLKALSATDTHVAVAGITLPNPASVGLHEKLGFRKVAEFPQIGRKFDRWLAVGYWQIILDRA